LRIDLPSGMPFVNSFYKSLTLWLVIGMVMVLVFNLFNYQKDITHEITFTEFLDQVDNGEVKEVVIQEDEGITGITQDGKTFRVYSPQYPDLIKDLRTKGVKIKAKPPRKESLLMTILVSWFPFLLLIGVWIFFMRQMQGGGNKALSFGKSRAKLLTEDQQKVTFKDVAGIDEAKEELQEVIEFLKDPKKFQKLGGKIPKGVLLMGPPGTGKTLLARAIAGEADVPFFTISGSDFVEMFVGVGASRVRDLFDQGKKHAPCIIFIDEIDAVGRHRGAGLGGGHDEREQTLNQLLVEMDGFESHESVILIAATNRPDVLDPALMRPGRFDRQVVVPNPDIKGREGILKVHTRKIPMAEDVDIMTLARGTPGFSGADLANMVNEGALLAARKNKDKVDMSDLESAKDKVMMGAERRSMVMTDEEKRNTAYHEAGHALVARLVPGADPVHKVTIIPRGRALGVTQQIPESDKYTYSKENMLARITVLLGGRASEELIFDQMTTGAGNDIERSTELARKMICEWGMSDKLGPVTFGKKEEQIFLGREISQHRDYSEATAVEIDSEVRRVVNECHDEARRLLQENIETLKRIAETLLDIEVLNAEQLDEIIDGKSPKEAKE